ncbi:unnamed protein product [Hydatigera taeniaeformis]|uniref:RING-type domain-containing protein n=1 Tax=Hydatigena taeniaeformis TaxID=6205 RepID=A0A0R3X0N1_HYDTA|nr:unnamed protein product [Hydatigera taeniaeformis]
MRSDVNIIFLFSVFNLRSEVMVKRRGGLMLSWTGARVEVPNGAVGGAKSHLILAPLPAAVRAYACPWLGPNLRLGSDVHLLWCSAKLRKFVQCFIPFSCATAIELTTVEATRKAEEGYAEKVKAARNAAKVAAKNASEGTITETLGDGHHQESPTPTSERKRDKKKAGRHERVKTVDYVAVGVPILDTRSVFVLQSKVGDNFWTLKREVEIVQPTVHYIEWPSRLREAAYKASRFSEHNAEGDRSSSPTGTGSVAGVDNRAGLSTPVGKSSGRGERRGGGVGGGGILRPAYTSDAEVLMRSARDNVTSLEVAKRAAVFTGGVTFRTDELCDFIAVVIGTPSETVAFDSDGGLLRSPILHPLFSVRIPKFAFKKPLTSTFKAIQVRKDLMEAIHHFDLQLTEINECSNIYELDLGTEAFERPVTVTLPLPLWYTQMVEQMRQHPTSNPSGAEVNDGDGGGGGAGEMMLDVEENKRDSKVYRLTGAAEGSRGGKKGDKNIDQDNTNNEIPIEERPKNLILVYQVSYFTGIFSSHRLLVWLTQRPTLKRQLVWRASTGDANSDNAVNRKRQTKSGNYRDTTTSAVLRGDSLNAKNGWMHLLLGLKGAPWKDVPINGPFTPRCLQINTYQLGRFAMVYSNDPQRTPSSKVAHLMARLEALSVAPPGVLLLCLHADPSRVCLWVDCVPSTKLIATIENRLNAGFVPLVQAGPVLNPLPLGYGNSTEHAFHGFMLLSCHIYGWYSSTASPSRRCAAIANCAYQSLQYLQSVSDSPPDKSPVRFVCLMPLLNCSFHRKSITFIPIFGTSKYRLSGFDLLRVLLYNGLCIRLVIKGQLLLRTRGLFDCLLTLLEAKRSLLQQQQAATEPSDAAESSTTITASQTIAEEAALLSGSRGNATSLPGADVVPPEQFITTTETRFSFHELLNDGATIIDLEPLRESFARMALQRARKENLIQNLLNRRLEELEEAKSSETRAEGGEEQDKAEEKEVEHQGHNIYNASDAVDDSSTILPSLRFDDFQSEDESDKEEEEIVETASAFSRESHNVEQSKRLDTKGELNEEDEVELEEDEWIPAGVDGDDEKTTMDTLKNLVDAFSNKNASLLGFHVTKDLCRRLTTIYDKGLSGDARGSHFFIFGTEAIELIDRVYEMYAVGRVEIYLVQPTDMAQVRERLAEDEEQKEEAEAKIKETNVSNPLARITPLEDDDIESAAANEGAILAQGVDETAANNKSDVKVSGRNQSNMKWNKKGDPLNPDGSMQQPLASYDVSSYFLLLSRKTLLGSLSMKFLPSKEKDKKNCSTTSKQNLKH